MPPLICPSPAIVDQTFPRNLDELRLVEDALERLIEMLEAEACAVILTEPLRQFIIDLEQNFDWTRAGLYPTLGVIYSVLTQLGLQQFGVHIIDVSSTSGHHQHPVPQDLVGAQLALTWSDELGRLWLLHSRRCQQGRCFIGVACARAFAGRIKSTYDNPGGLPAFPLVGPDEVVGLDDAFDWDVPDDLQRRQITFGDAYRRIGILGGRINQPSGSSHYQVQFTGGRTWPLDRNFDEIPDRFIQQLVPITRQSLVVIRYVLIFGEWPKRRLRI